MSKDDTHKKSEDNAPMDALNHFNELLKRQKERDEQKKRSRKGKNPPLPFRGYGDKCDGEAE